MKLHMTYCVHEASHTYIHGVHVMCTYIHVIHTYIHVVLHTCTTHVPQDLFDNMYILHTLIDGSYC